MARLGELIKSQRQKYHMTPKQLAKKCGVSESFILEVESGRRIPGDVIATRILKAMGAAEDLGNLSGESAVFTDAAPAARPTPAVKPAPVPVPAKTAEVSDTWKDALSGMLKQVPVYDSAQKRIGSRMLALQDGKIEGVKPEKVYYLQAADNTMRSYRICAGDLLLCLPVNAMVDRSIMSFLYQGKRLVRRLRKIEGNKAEMQWFESGPESCTVELSELSDLARVARIEITL